MTLILAIGGLFVIVSVALAAGNGPPMETEPMSTKLISFLLRLSVIGAEGLLTRPNDTVARTPLDRMVWAGLGDSIVKKTVMLPS